MFKSTKRANRFGRTDPNYRKASLLKSVQLVNFASNNNCTLCFNFSTTKCEMTFDFKKKVACKPARNTHTSPKQNDGF